MHFIKKNWKVTFFTLGIILWLINIIGLFIPLKNQDIYRETSGFTNDITLSTNEDLKLINQPIIDKKKYVTTVNKALNRSILHNWNTPNDYKYNIILPIYENYILYILTHTFFRKNALRYEFCNYKKTVERGVGFCSQISTALADILNKKGIPTNVISWPQHVITEVQVADNEWWVVDPDYGVIVKNSIDTITKNPSLIIPAYKQAGYSNDEMLYLMKIFNEDNVNNRIIYTHTGSGYANCNGVRKIIEDLSYIFI